MVSWVDDPPDAPGGLPQLRAPARRAPLAGQDNVPEGHAAGQSLPREGPGRVSRVAHLPERTL
eukprot:3433473-Alexandrium_andersonii.AAC.1